VYDDGGFPTEGYPRGQASATMMVSEIGRPGDWTRSLQAPFLDKFTAPTVEGVDFPALGPPPHSGLPTCQTLAPYAQPWD
jgi:hypothetical protein